jgi:hypothetical protein
MEAMKKIIGRTRLRIEIGPPKRVSDALPHKPVKFERSIEININTVKLGYNVIKGT